MPQERRKGSWTTGLNFAAFLRFLNLKKYNLKIGNGELKWEIRKNRKEKKCVKFSDN